jgi:hypothetical protein
MKKKIWNLRREKHIKINTGKYNSFPFEIMNDG